MKYLSILQLRKFNVKGTTLVNREGLIIASFMNEEIQKDADALRMITGLLQGISERIKNEFKTGLFKNAMIETDRYIFYFVEAGDDAILTTILDNSPNLDLGGIRPYTLIFTRKIDDVLSGKKTTSEIVEVEPAMPTAPSVIQEEIAPENHFKCKAIIIGDFSVGKTSLLVQFAEKKFTVDYKPTIGVFVVKKEYYFEETNTLVDLLLYDIAAQSRFLSLRYRYYEGASISMIVFDVTRPETLDSVHNWYYDVSKFLGEKIPSIVVANKTDLTAQRKVDTNQAKILAKTLELPYIETSAKTADNVDKAFKILVQEFLKARLISGE